MILIWQDISAGNAEGQCNPFTVPFSSFPRRPPCRRCALETSTDRAAVLSGGVFFGEGGGFHALGIPTVGYLPSPQFLCAMSPDGEISKLDPAIYHDQLELSAKLLLSMQATSAQALKAAS